VTARTGLPFRQRLNGMPNVGQQKGGWDLDDHDDVMQWLTAPMRAVTLTDLIAVNRKRYLDETIVTGYRTAGVTLAPRIWVLRRQGWFRSKLYVVDGHHRCVAAWREGRKTIQAHVLTID
jgi:hypothetical protein